MCGVVAAAGREKQGFPSPSQMADYRSNSWRLCNAHSFWPLASEAKKERCKRVVATAARQEQAILCTCYFVIPQVCGTLHFSRDTIRVYAFWAIRFYTVFVKHIARYNSISYRKHRQSKSPSCRLAMLQYVFRNFHLLLSRTLLKYVLALSDNAPRSARGRLNY